MRHPAPFPPLRCPLWDRGGGKFVFGTRGWLRYRSMNGGVRGLYAWVRMMMRWLPWMIFFAACGDDEGVRWVPFNHDRDELVIEVTAGAELGDPVESELRSTTGAASIGDVWVSPGSGPVGTEHEVRVLVDARYTDRVGRVQVKLVAEGRGEYTFRLQRDSADAGYFVASLTSYGVEGEVREDKLRVVLLERVEIDDDDEEDE